MPRINFFSATFLSAFGLGTFVGVCLALLAVALARPADKTTVIDSPELAIAGTPTTTASATPLPSATATPLPSIRTVTTLQVRIGPNEEYAILGTLAGGSEIALEGRDDTGDWVAIEFPPESNARGWIPRQEVQGLSLSEVQSLDILQASLIDTTPTSPDDADTTSDGSTGATADFPAATDTPTAFEGNDGVPTATPEPRVTPRATPTETDSDDEPTPAATATRRATATPTTESIAYGPTDLAFVGASANEDGTVSVVVQNLGPGDVPRVSVVVSAPGFPPELMSSGVLRVGESASFQTSSIQLTGTTSLSITIDPNGELTDSNRGNNTRTATLTP
jgi:hypothetical protein